MATRIEQFQTHCTDIFPVLTHPLLGGMVRGCCHSAIAVLERLGRSLGIPVEPLPVGVAVLNRVAARHYLDTGEVFGELPVGRFDLLAQQGARSVRLPYEKLEGERFDTGGHLIALVPSLGLLVDPTAEQFSFPEMMNIHVPHPIVTKVSVDEMKRTTKSSPLQVWVDDALCLYYYEPRMTYWRDSPNSDYNNKERIDRLERLVRDFYGEGRRLPPLPPIVDALAQLEALL